MRVLPISIHHHNPFAFGKINAGRDGQLMSEISGKINKPNMAVLFRHAAQNSHRAVFGAIVYVYHFPGYFQWI
jgi:hypothetical protein